MMANTEPEWFYKIFAQEPWMHEKKQYITDDGEIISTRFTEFTDSLNKDGYRFPSKKLGSRIFSDVKFPDGMSRDFIGGMTILARNYMVNKTNMLGYRDHSSIWAYTGPEIAELAGYKERQGRRFIKKMLKLHVLHKVIVDAEIQYYVNPAYFMGNGQRLSLNLYLLFKDELTPLLPDWVMMEFLRQAQPKALFGSDAVREVEGMY